MPAAVPQPDRSEEIHLGIFAETVRAVRARAERPWPRPYPNPYPDPDEVVIPPPRPSRDPVPPPSPEERTLELAPEALPRYSGLPKVRALPRPRALPGGRAGAVDEPTEPALTMLSGGRHGWHRRVQRNQGGSGHRRWGDR